MTFLLGNPEKRPEVSSRKQIQQEAPVMLQEQAWAEQALSLMVYNT